MTAREGIAGRMHGHRGAKECFLLDILPIMEI